MRKLITILFVIFCQVTFGQVYQLMPQYGYSAPRMNFDSTLTIPTTNGVPTLKSNILRKGALAIDSTNGRFYFYNPKTLVWDTIKGGSSSSDTASVVKALVHNAEATTITKGSVVYLFGAAGNVASVKRAYNKSDTFSSKTFAIVKEDIGAGQRGTVITQGVVDKLNLGSYSEGDILWLDSIAGQFTKNKPSAPYHQVFIGVVERANNGNGQLYVKVQNGYELGELHNVSVNGQANNDVLYYQSSTQLWKAKSPYLLVDTSGLSNRINVKLNASDTSSLSNRINTKLNSADSTIYQTKFRSDSARTNTYTSLSTKHNLSDSITYQTKFRSDTARTNVWNQLAQELNVSDTNVFQRKSIAAYSFQANNTNAIANSTTTIYKDIAVQTLSSGITWNGTAPSGTTNHSYRWNQLGKLVIFNATLNYGTAGSSNSQLTIVLPSDLPTPESPTSLTNASEMLYFGAGSMNTSTTAIITVTRPLMLRRNAANNGYEIIMTQATATAVKYATLTIQYFAQ